MGSVTKMKLTVLLVLALAAIATATPFHRAIGLKGPVEPRCDGPECPGGCCPGPECPGGCCPNAGWFCCPGDEYCAASEEYCKRADFAKILMSMAAPKKIVKQDCPGIECPGGCCPNAGWFCCPGDEYCAASEEYCKKINI